MTAGPRNAKAISVLFQPAIMAVISMQKKDNWNKYLL